MGCLGSTPAPMSGIERECREAIDEAEHWHWAACHAPKEMEVAPFLMIGLFVGFCSLIILFTPPATVSSIVLGGIYLVVGATTLAIAVRILGRDHLFVSRLNKRK